MARSDFEPQKVCRQSYIPLSVRHSTLQSLDFDLVQVMEGIKNCDSIAVACRTDGESASSSPVAAASEQSTIAVAKTPETLSSEDPVLQGCKSDSIQGSKLRSFTSRISLLSTPPRSKFNVTDAEDRLEALPFVTPSKNNVGKADRDVGVESQDQFHRLWSPSSTVFDSSASTICVNSLETETPARSNGKDSVKRMLFRLFSPRAAKSSRSFSTADFFGVRTPLKHKSVANNEDLVGPLEFLRTQQPPNLEQHPMIASDSFNCRSAAPLMFTSMTANEARLWAIGYYRAKKELWKEKQVRPFVKGEPFPVFKQPVWIDKLEGDQPFTTPATLANAGVISGAKQELLAVQTSPSLDTSRGLRMPLRIDTKAANRPVPDVDIATNTVSLTTNETTRKTGSTSIRNLSNMFQGRSGVKCPSSGSSTAEGITVVEDKEGSRIRKERYLRTITNCPSFDYHHTSVYPRHPNTGRDWRSRNLRCAGCQWITCCVCGRACCARAACFYAMENHKESVEGIERAREIKYMIERVVPTNSEVQTFLVCTSCKGNVCPDCCGMCPDEACQDIQCRYCKKGDPWDECEWHKGMVMKGGGRTVSGTTRMTI